MKIATALWRVLRGFGLVLAAIVIFTEEWGWRPLTALAALLARWLHLQRLEARISATSPIVALLLFLAPALLLFPLKLLALWVISEGSTGLGSPSSSPPRCSAPPSSAGSSCWSSRSS